MVRSSQLFTVVLWLGLAARGAVAAEVAAAAPGASTASPLAAAAVETPTAGSSAEVPMVNVAAQAAPPARFGVGARLRLTSVPKWMLGFLLDQSVPLTSYTTGLEFFRRSGSFDFVLGVAYQSLSPNAGNWLGKGSDSSTETDYVQFDGLSSWSFDAAFIRHEEFSENFGMHYGGGVGIGIVKGQLLRTSNGSPGCVSSPGDPTKCYPIICPQGPCTEAQLRDSEGGSNDSNLAPSRHPEGRVPSVYPIVNLLVGIDVRLPTVTGLAMKLDVGYFFPYFFFGPTVAYQI